MFLRFWTIYLIFFLGSIKMLYAQKDEAKFVDLKSKLAEPSLKDTQRIFLLNEFAQYLTELDSAAALGYAKEALNLAQKHDKPKEEAKSNITLARLAYINNKPLQADQYLDKAVEISQSSDEPELEIEALQVLAYQQIRQNDRKTAFSTIGKLKKLSEKNNYDSGIAQSHLLLGDWFKEESIEEAIQNYEDALRTFQFNNEQENTILTLSKIGTAYYEQEEWENAINYHNQALQISEQTENPRLITNSLNKLGNIYNQKKDHRVALQRYFQAYIIALEYDFFNNGKTLAEATKGIRDTYANLAKTAPTLTEKAKYQNLYYQYKKIHQDLQKSNYDIGKYQKKRSTLQSRAKELPLEKQYRLLAIEKEKLEIDNLAKAKKISLLEEAQKKAKLRAEEDSILIQGLHDKIAELNREKDQSESQINDLQQKNAKQEKALSQKQGSLIWWIVGLGLITLLAVLYGLYRSRTQKQAQSYQNDKLNQYNERINKQEISIREKEDNILEKQKELHSVYAELDDAKLEKNALTQMLDAELKPPLKTLVRESEKGSINRLVIHQSGKQMLNLITSIVTIQNLNKAKLTLFKEKISLYKLIERTLEQVSTLTKEKELEVQNKVKTFFYIEADQDVVEHAVLNLLHNAIKYTPNQGKISIDASHKSIGSQDFTEVRIEDNGQTIPKESLKLVFDRFNTDEEARPDALNLAFAKLAVEAHGGEISVDSDQDKTTFIFTIPSVKPEVVKRLRKEEEEEIIKSKENLLEEEDRKYIKPYLFELQQLEIFETTSLLATISEISVKDNPRLKKWKGELRKAIYSLDELKFKELIT